VAFGRAAASADTREDPGDRSAGTAAGSGPTAAGLRWAALLRRAFGFDVLTCPCGGRRRLVALIDEATVIRRILEHRGLPTEIPVPRPGRSAPLLNGLDECRAR
jgi:hypothetical protein